LIRGRDSFSRDVCKRGKAPESVERTATTKGRQKGNRDLPAGRRSRAGGGRQKKVNGFVSTIWYRKNLEDDSGDKTNSTVSTKGGGAADVRATGRKKV